MKQKFENKCFPRNISSLRILQIKVLQEKSAFLIVCIRANDLYTPNLSNA